MKLNTLAATLLLFASGSSYAQKVQFEYRDVYRSQQALRPVADARYLRPGLRLIGKGFERSTESVILTVKGLQQDLGIRVDPNGNFDLPASSRLQQENPQIWSNIDRTNGSVEVQAALRVEAPAQQEFSYQLIDGMRTEFRNSRGLMTRFFSPSIRGVIIDFGANGVYTATLTSSGTARTIESESSGYLRLPLTDELIAQRATVKLNAMPVAIRLEME